MYQSLERYVPLFEAYLRAEDQPQFIKQLTDPNERNVLQLLTKDITNINSLREDLNKAQFHHTLLDALVEQKMVTYIEKTDKFGDN